MSKKEDDRGEPNPKTLGLMSVDNQWYLVSNSKDPCQDESNANYVTTRLAKKITVRRNYAYIIIMYLHDMQRENNEKLYTIIQRLESLENTFLKYRKYQHNGGTF